MKKNGFTDANVPDQTGHCYMVTGANAGIGFATARVLASKGARVLLACRNQLKANDAIQRIKNDLPDANLGFIPLDQANLASVSEAAASASQEERLDALINNAGIMYTHRNFTKDVFEQHFGINHLGTFALTLLLLPKLQEQKGSRVVITSSLVHRNGKGDFENSATDSSSSPTQLYANSKLANLLFMFELDRRLRAAGSSITTAACHPGLAATELSRDMPRVVQAMSPLLGMFVNSPLQGAWPTLQAACDPEVKPGGYYGPQKMGGARGPSGPARHSVQATSEDLAQKLWKISENLTGASFDL